MSNLPKIQELYNDKVTTAKADQFMALMNHPPKPEWVRVHPYIKGYKYLPIERVEFLLKTIFKRYRIEITGQGQSFNGVWVTVRVHYINPVTGDWDFNDGIGAAQIQTKKGESPADLSQITNNAIGIAFPIAKTEAIKNACKSFGKLFGSDLSRTEDIHYQPDVTLIELNENHPNWLKVVEAVKSGSYKVDDIKSKYYFSQETEEKLLNLAK